MMRDVPVQRDGRPGDGFAHDIQELERKVDQVRNGSISEAEFRAFRVPLGIYEQRQAGTYMLRCRFPGGVVQPAHLRTLAAVARRFGSGILHVTTRQDVQVQRVSLDGLHPALVELHAGGISTKGGGGNTVRNITTCALAGSCPREAFDVTPHAQELTARLLRDPLSFQLPRKYKIAFSGCGDDCAGATVSDVGFIAKDRDGRVGFSVYAGGGLGADSRVAELLEAFVPAQEAYVAAEAVKRVFDRHGNRKNRNRARLRFLVETLGPSQFRSLYQAEAARVRQQVTSTAPAGCDSSAASAQAPLGVLNRRNEKCQVRVAGQHPPGAASLLLRLTLGDIDADTAERLSQVTGRYGRVLRATQEQNFLVHHNGAAEDVRFEAELAALGMGSSGPPFLRNMTVCAGASACRLGICQSRGLATAVSAALGQSGLDLVWLGDARLHISGCPNACGRHPVAQVGLYGVAKRFNGRLVPHYILQLGGRLGEGRTRLAAGRWAIPARSVPPFLTDFFRACLDSNLGDLEAFLDSEGARVADRLAPRYSHVPDFEADERYYYDWSATEVFSLAGRGPSECGAGVFDLIELDLAGAADALVQGEHHRATVLAARALLVTRGEQPVGDAEALELFRQLFVEQELVDPDAGTLVDDATDIAASPDRERLFADKKDEATALVAAVRQLYESMDASLRFNPDRTAS